MFCTRCGNKLSEKDKFCGKCGAKAKESNDNNKFLFVDEKNIGKKEVKPEKDKVIYKEEEKINPILSNSITVLLVFLVLLSSILIIALTTVIENGAL